MRGVGTTIDLIRRGEGVNLFVRALRRDRRGIVPKAIQGTAGIVAIGAIFLAALAVREDFRKQGEARARILAVHPEHRETTTTPATPPSPPPDLQKIAERNIFGPFVGRATPAPVVKPAVNIPLELIGTFVSDASSSYAIIEDTSKKQQDVFAKGDTVFQTATLEVIAPEFVQILRNGQLETLQLDLIGKGKGGSGSGSSRGNEFVVDEGELDRALANLPMVLTQARAVPYFKDGQAIGLRLFAIRPGSIFERLGLKNGDILKSINGNSLGDLTQAMRLFERLKSERSLALQLERGREDQEFRYQVQ